jgi:malate dehydrogenase (oxaloacetate-decarboxylating)(NADP+)
MSPMTKRQDALDYHSNGRPGKIAVVPTKPLTNQRDLSLAYSPGVAEPCLEIQRDPDLAYSSPSSPTAPPCSGLATSGPWPASR